MRFKTESPKNSKTSLFSLDLLTCVKALTKVSFFWNE